MSGAAGAHRARADATFDSRAYSLGERLTIALADGALAVVGTVLRLGGAPLREALCRVLGFLGYRKVRQVKAPERAIYQAQEAANALKRS